MAKFKNKYRIESTRLKNYDYSQNGYYFVTICTKHRFHHFGVIKNGKMVLNRYGKIVQKCWDDLPNHYWNCKLDAFIIMPDHIHGIVVIDNNSNCTIKTNKYPLSEIIRGFKTFSSRKINDIKTTHKFSWQARYYDNIIRSKKSLQIIRKYILYNAEKCVETGLKPVSTITPVKI